MQQRQQKKSVTWVNERHPGAPLVEAREIPGDNAAFRPVARPARRGRALDAAALAATIDERRAWAREQRRLSLREYLGQHKRLASTSRHYPPWAIWKSGGRRRGAAMSNADVLAWIKEHRALTRQNAAASGVRNVMKQSVTLLLEDQRRRAAVRGRG